MRPPGPLQTASGKQQISGTLHDVLAWRLFGAALWHAAILLAMQALMACLLLLIGQSSAWSLLGVRGLALFASQVLVLLCHSRVMVSSEAAPIHIPKLGQPSRTLISNLLSRVLIRGRKLADVLAVACMYAATAACATCYCYLHPSIGGHAVTLRWCLVLGTTTGVFYTSQHLLRYADRARLK